MLDLDATSCSTFASQGRTLPPAFKTRFLDNRTTVVWPRSKRTGADLRRPTSDSSERVSSSLLSSGNALSEALLAGCRNCQYGIHKGHSRTGVNTSVKGRKGPSIFRYYEEKGSEMGRLSS